MLTLDDLRALARPLAEAGDAPTIRLDLDEDALAIFALFAEDDPPAAVRLVLRGQAVGVMRHDDVLEFFPVGDKSFGASSGFLVPGSASTRAFRRIVLDCPVAGCPASPVRTPRFDPADPPSCDVHHSALLSPRS